MTDYEEYLQSREWARIRNEAMSAAEWRCQICGTHSSKATLEAHHRDYRRLGKPGELKDVTVLCARCHELFHERLNAIGQRNHANAGIEQCVEAANAIVNVGEVPTGNLANT